MRKPILQPRLRAFSLIEMAMVLAVSGLMIGFVLQANQSAGKTECYTVTKTQMSTIRSAIELFARKNDRLPLPAARNIGVENVKYGREASGADIDAAAGISFGALPFQALGLAPSYGVDCWGNKFSYAVTTALTTSSTSGGYLDGLVKGNIKVTNGSAVMNTQVAYAVISHGEDGFGAVKGNYTAANAGNGPPDTAHKWCTGGIPTLKSYNCAASSDTLADAVFNNGKDAGTNYYDDIIVSSGRPQVANRSNLWCWGTDRNGQGLLADGNTSAGHFSYSPRKAAGGPPLVSLAPAYGQTLCGLTADNSAYCWGQNNAGQVGDGTTINRAVPTAVVSPVKFKTGSLMFDSYYQNFYCGISKTDSTAWCWGNFFNSTILPQGQHTATQVSASYQFQMLLSFNGNGICGLTLAGDIYCKNVPGWVYGSGTYPFPTPPDFYLVPGGHKYSKIVNGRDYTGICGLTSAADPGGAGHLYCWGLTNDYEYYGAWANFGMPLGLPKLTITNISKSNPGVVTYTGAFTVVPGDSVLIRGVNGMGEVNYNVFTVASTPTANTFTINGQRINHNGDGPVNTTGYGTYTSGGEILYNGRNMPTEITVPGVTWGKLINGQTAISTTGQSYSWGSNEVGQLGNSSPGRQSTWGTLSNANPAVMTTTDPLGIAPGDDVYFGFGDPYTLRSAGIASITLAASASTTDQAYAGQTIVITGGTGVGQVFNTNGYVGATRKLDIINAWSILPDATSQYLIGNPESPQAVTSATTIKLPGGYSATDGAYNGQTITVYYGAGAGQTVTITAYDGTTKVATISPAWTTWPNGSSAYMLNGVQGTAQSASNTTTLTLDTTDNSTTGYYNGKTLWHNSGNGYGIPIISYDGPTRVATVNTSDMPWVPPWNWPSRYHVSSITTNAYYKVGTVYSPTQFELLTQTGVPIDNSISPTSFSGGVGKISTCFGILNSTYIYNACTPEPMDQTYGGGWLAEDVNTYSYPYTARGNNRTYVWGVGWMGGTGDGTPWGSWTPVPIDAPGINLSSPIYQAGRSNNCMIADDTETLYCWINYGEWYGNAGDGGNSTRYLSPHPVAGIKAFGGVVFGGLWDDAASVCTLDDDAKNNCPASTTNWGSGCSAPYTAMKNGDTQPLTNTAGGHTGSVTATCIEGVIVQSAGSCS